ncbi:hypothetical protein FAZ69_24090 [Trinickia terrae]|uniref:Uncharacterized protein n=1 Tax=Trinickia terrae TaxID=2571161 RepID=A0A4U1HQ58_9BURK|nr:hypothetical protein FAZ69_24090 [Trinickia terrae]
MASQSHSSGLPGDFSTKLSTGSSATGQFLMRIQNLAANVMFYFNFAAGAATRRSRRPAGAAERAGA